MLKITHLHKTFFPNTPNEKKALRGVNLTLEEGDFVTVIGSNGSGKSTLMNCIAGVFYPDKGHILIDGVDVTRMPEHVRAKYIGRVFQDPMKGTAADMQVAENLAMASRRGKPLSLKWSSQSSQLAEFREALKELDLGLENRLETRIIPLPGGKFLLCKFLYSFLEFFLRHCRLITFRHNIIPIRFCELNINRLETQCEISIITLLHHLQ